MALSPLYGTIACPHCGQGGPRNFRVELRNTYIEHAGYAQLSDQRSVTVCVRCGAVFEPEAWVRPRLQEPQAPPPEPPDEPEPERPSRAKPTK